MAEIIEFIDSGEMPEITIFLVDESSPALKFITAFSDIHNEDETETYRRDIIITSISDYVELVHGMESFRLFDLRGSNVP